MKRRSFFAQLLGVAAVVKAGPAVAASLPSRHISKSAEYADIIKRGYITIDEVGWLEDFPPIRIPNSEARYLQSVNWRLANPSIPEQVHDAVDKIVEKIAE